ncbi:BREX-1 system adenine-specific DNA-methyltransferase PglX [Levilactobacillus namurensis]|uniref:BREX-1 system adenine-specific DNA-methyltransferase PglX n=1 Tax=Levilactobacillus namurensis TaxID=380393 RepID=UPI0036F3E05C
MRHLIEDVDEADFDVTQGGQVEIIGWLYQYYNTEPKDRAFKKRKYEETDIPAVTQLFTPDWIVKYMVENSLGHYWIRVLQARGDMRSEKEVATSMGWQYLMPTAPQTPAVTLAVNADQRELANVRPEDITLIDAAMGSGHILIYAFEVLMIIYGQEGYSRREAAKLIVEKNLWGLDIDTRAFQLAYFALMMKGRQYHRRFLELNIRPNVFDVPDSQGLSVDDFQAVLYNQQERTAVSDILTLFKYGNEYGSLIMPPDTLDWEALQDIANRQPQLGQLSLGTIALADKQQRLKELIATGEVLAHQYTLGVMNPPYMGSGKMDAILAKYVKKHFPNSKADLFGVFMERLQDLVQPNGYFAMITQHAWMFLSSFEKLRQALRQTTLLNMAHLGTRAFEEIGGEVVQSTTFVFKKQTVPTFVGNYERLVAFDSQSKKEQAYLAAVQNPEIDYLYRTNQANFTKIPGMPIAYWASENLLHDFEVGTRMDELAAPHVGLQTGNNTLFLRQWFEVQHSRINFQASSLKDAEQSGKKWFPYNKGGSYRKWYGNYDYVVNWEDNGYEIRHFTDSKGKVRSRPQNTDYYFHEAITWSLITSGNFSMRYREHGSIHDVSGMSVFSTNSNNLKIILGIMNSPVGNYIFKIVNPTINLQIGNVTSFPVMIDKVNDSPLPIIDRCIYMEKEDWNSREISWNFGTSPLLTHIADEQLAHCRSPIGV